MTTYGNFFGTAKAAPRREMRGGPLTGRLLARALSRMRPLVRVQMTTSLALSTRRDQKLALAEALTRTDVEVLGAHSVIEHLARDSAPQVRRAAARAAWARVALDPTRLMGVIDRLARDPDPEVRDLARLAGGQGKR